MTNSADWKEPAYPAFHTQAAQAARERPRSPKSITQVTAQSFHKRTGGLGHWAPSQECQEMLVGKAYFEQIRAKAPAHSP